MARRAPDSSGGAKVTGKAPSVAQLAESVNITLYFNSCVGRKYSPPGRAKRARPCDITAADEAIVADALNHLDHGHGAAVCRVSALRFVIVHAPRPSVPATN